LPTAGNEDHQPAVDWSRVTLTSMTAVRRRGATPPAGARSPVPDGRGTPPPRSRRGRRPRTASPVRPRKTGAVRIYSWQVKRMTRPSRAATARRYSAFGWPRFPRKTVSRPGVVEFDCHLPSRPGGHPRLPRREWSGIPVRCRRRSARSAR
jgi:hypothetical protein